MKVLGTRISRVTPLSVTGMSRTHCSREGYGRGGGGSGAELREAGPVSGALATRAAPAAGRPCAARPSASKALVQALMPVQQGWPTGSAHSWLAGASPLSGRCALWPAGVLPCSGTTPDAAWVVHSDSARATLTGSKARDRTRATSRRIRTACSLPSRAGNGSITRGVLQRSRRGCSRSPTPARPRQHAAFSTALGSAALLAIVRHGASMTPVLCHPDWVTVQCRRPP